MSAQTPEAKPTPTTDEAVKRLVVTMNGEPIALSMEFADLTRSMERDVNKFRQSAAMAADLAAALESLTEIIKAAGVERLASAVQLGQMSWFFKCSDRMEAAEKCLVRFKASAHEAKGRATDA